MTIFDTAPPKGTVRDWLDSQAEVGGAAIAYKFTDGTAPCLGVICEIAHVTWHDISLNWD